MKPEHGYECFEEFIINFQFQLLAGPEYRAKVELVEAISRALPVQDRGDGSSRCFYIVTQC